MQSRADVAVFAGLCTVSVLRAQPCNDAWTPIPSTTAGFVDALGAIDLGTGPNLYGVRVDDPPPGVVLRTLVRWHGSGWDEIAAVSESIFAFGKYDDGGGAAAFFGGSLYSIGGVVSPGLIRWDGVSFSPVPTGWTFGQVIVASMCVYDDGTGPGLVVSGYFPGGVGGIPSAHIGKWDGETWSGFGGGFSGGFAGAAALGVFDDDGPGSNTPSLYAGGAFTHAGGVLVRHIAKWDGHQWHALGGGFEVGNEGGSVNALVVYDDGAGPALYAGGTFLGAVGVPGTKLIARWDGAAWSGVGAGVLGVGIGTMLVFDDGVRGPGLIAGGNVAVPGGVPYVARYDRTGWSDLGEGGPEGMFYYMARYDEGPTPTLWVNASVPVGPGQWTTLARYQYACEPCYPDCDGSGTLTLADFNCFQTRFVAADPEADCNASGTLTIADFGCFQTRFVAGCP